MCQIVHLVGEGGATSQSAESEVEVAASAAAPDAVVEESDTEVVILEQRDEGDGPVPSKRIRQ